MKHKDEIQALVTKPFLDILAINESKIDGLIPDSEIHIAGYNLIRKDRSKSGGGAVLYIRDSIPFSERKALTPDCVEMVCIEVRRPHNKSLLISTWYRQQNLDIDLFDEDELFLRKCDFENKELIQFMILEMRELVYILRWMNDLQALYSENDRMIENGDRTCNLLMTGETL